MDAISSVEISEERRTARVHRHAEAGLGSCALSVPIVLAGLDAAMRDGVGPECGGAGGIADPCVLALVGVACAIGHAGSEEGIGSVGTGGHALLGDV